MATGKPKVNTAFRWYYLLVDDTDFVTPEPGKTPAVFVSKDGAAFVAATGTPASTEIADGWYYADFVLGDINAATVILKATATGAIATERFMLDELLLTDLKKTIGASPNKKRFDPAADTIEVFDADGSTVLTTFTASEVSGKIELTPS